MQSTIRIHFLVTLLLILTLPSCTSAQNETPEEEEKAVFYHNHQITVGAEKLDEYLPLLRGKKVGLVVNQTSMVNDKHLVDVLLKMNIDVVKIFAPEHGFRGHADAGELVKDGIDVQTGLPIISLYGKNKKPSAEQIADLDILVFDIQDVGARFYTYISTMHYVMEAAAENNKQVLVLDRPNPNGHYIAGPIMEDEFKSFVGKHPVPIVHGMTVGEYAQMINGEKWLKDGIKCDLKVIKCDGYDHTKFYKLPIAPSPNLPNMRSIYLYPTLCLFEGTDISVGRGTQKQFQILGSPNLSDKRLDSEFNGMQANFEFTPMSMDGAKHPKHENKICKGIDLSTVNEETIRDMKSIDLLYLKGIYELHNNKPKFFNDFFYKLSGTKNIQASITSSSTEKIKLLNKEIDKELVKFQSTRKKYLLYTDF